MPNTNNLSSISHARRLHTLFLVIPAILLGPVTIPAVVADTTLPNDGITLETITVRGGLADSLITSDAASARRQLDRWPGNVSMIRANDYDDGAVLGLRDALSRAPGIYIQNAGSQESGKLSIRGSGLASPLGLRGVRLLRDGLPLSRADDVADPSYADPFNADYIKIHRGSNALQYGAATLGGAINLISPTGYSHPGLETRFEAGPNGYLRTQARAGQVFDNGMDAFISVGSFQMSGSSDDARQANSRLYGNLGFRFSPTSQGRLHLAIENLTQGIANTLKAPGYGIVNFKLGYAAPNEKYRLFLDARNLTNKRYAASTEYTDNAHGQNPQVFNIGLQRALFAGVEVHW